MRGKYNIRIQNSKVCFDLEIRRSITVIKGKSGTGKTTLLTMLREWKALGRKSGITCISNCEFAVFDHLTHWDYELKNRHNTVIFVDEGIDYVFSEAFAHELIHSGNYLVCITRSSYLRNFPYAISEIYEFRTLQKNKSNITRMYQKYSDMDELSEQDVVITEDSNSGFEMMQKLFDCQVVSARGNTCVFQTVSQYLGETCRISVVVDGAAFGAYIQELMNLKKYMYLNVLAPESFEYLLLNTSAFRRYLTTELDETYNHCESRDFFTWEQYFTQLLTRLIKEHYSNFAYNKSHLNMFFQNSVMYMEVKKQLTENYIIENI